MSPSAVAPRYRPETELVHAGTSRSQFGETSEALFQTQGFVYVYGSDGEPTLALYERRTNYSGLGPKLAQSSRANFNTVVAELERLATNARVDGRLARPAGLGAIPLAPSGRDAAAWKRDVAVALLELAFG